MVNKVYYINLNYLCDNICIFCYSHNTNQLKNSSLTLTKLKSLFEKYSISEKDRIILNGGEPLLHKEINEILNFLHQKGVEILIFTNGRNIRKLDAQCLNKNIRFIIPIHGDREIHNFITKDERSFDDTVDSLKWLADNNFQCQVDIKIILNEKTIEENGFNSSLRVWKSLPFSSLHITKMMDTKTSITNGCISLEKERVNLYTSKLFNEFKDSKKIKLYSTCIKGIFKEKEYFIINNPLKIELLYIDYQSERYITLERKEKECELNCRDSKFCLSEVDEYNVLEFYKNKIYKNME